MAVEDIKSPTPYELIDKLQNRVHQLELWCGWPCPDCKSKNIKSDDFGHRWCDDCEPNKYHTGPFGGLTKSKEIANFAVNGTRHSPELRDSVQEMIEGLLKKQRELCANQVECGDGEPKAMKAEINAIRELVLNTPEPE